MAENNEAAAAPAKKSKLKLIILLVVVVLLAVGLSVAGTLWFLQSSGGSEEGTEAVAEEEVFQPSQYYVMDKALVATLQSEGRQRYGQIYLAFAARDPAALAAVEKHMPLLRSQLLSLLGAQSFTDLRTVAGRDALIEAMLTQVNETLAAENEPPIEQILFRNFVLQ
ncbi:MAG: flagellar basal body-associated FliL family protein [Marinobacter sp.]|uniref:flagellar basal body-associated FliL family protein n=1 Tax=Marinobacter sp. TaxID=50741 RepID=UPI00299F4B43|nr:flagellar basal body-associated FliL family protein [Marinobacter sp.]MDX1633475.1 flagellar basal body-associated FliL family protein [Marinobacter sp.]